MARRVAFSGGLQELGGRGEASYRVAADGLGRHELLPASVGKMENALLDALRTLSPLNVILIGVIVFLWKEYQKERDARISSHTATLELGHVVRTALERHQDLLTQLLARKD